MSLANTCNLLGRAPKLTAGSGGVGNVVGPASSTDTALVRWNGTTGKLVKDSNVTLADSGTALVFSGAAGLTASGSNQSITLTPSGTGFVQWAINGNTNRMIGYAGAIGSGGTIELTSSNSGGALIARDNSGTQQVAIQSAGVNFLPNHLLLGGLQTDGTGVLQFPNHATNAGGIALGTGLFLWAATSGGSGLGITGKISSYNGISTSGWGVSTVQADGNIAAATNARSAAVAAYTVGAADGTFVVGAALNVTASTAFSFSLDVSYTDDSNVARVLVLPLAQLAGTFVASGLATNILGAGTYESAAMTIRCKASTSITIRPSAGGTYTTVTYSVAANIRQVG